MGWRPRVLVVAIAGWAVWLVLANLFLLPAIGPALIARHPERFHIGWDRAWSVLPGLAHVRGFECGGHTRNRLWRVRVERGRVLVNLPALDLRTFHGLWPRATGGDVRSGSLRMARPLEVDAEVALSAMDARPILALASERSKAASWVDRLVDTENLQGRARISTRSGPLEVRELELTAGRAAISGELCLERGRPSMLLLLSLGDSHVGLERGPEGGDWHLGRPTRWFAERRPDFACR